jgi:hypothetical protein
MGRRPSGERAMTAAERQRKRRERLGIGGPVFAATEILRNRRQHP